MKNQRPSAEAHVIATIGRDKPETRLYSGAVAHLAPGEGPLLVVAGFTDGGEGRTAQLSVLRRDEDGWITQGEATWSDARESSIRNLCVDDLDGDGRDEIVILGRAGDDSHSARAELRILGLRGSALNVLGECTWSLGDYTHGYGLALGDVDGDGRAEIVAGGFAGREDREFAYLRVLRWSGASVELLAESTAEDPRCASTRINSIAMGRLGGGHTGIVAAGRSGPAKPSEGSPVEEHGLLIAWELRQGRLQEVARQELSRGVNTRLRTVKIADIDGDGQDEVLVAGQHGRPGRPLLAVYKYGGGGFELIGEAPWADGDAVGEVKDLLVCGSGKDLRVIATGPAGAKPARQGQIHVWRYDGAQLKLDHSATTAMGQETRARALLLWPDEHGTKLLTVGHAAGEEDGYGQLLEWSPGRGPAI